MTDIAAMEVELDLDSGQFSAKIKRAGELLTIFGKTTEEIAAKMSGLDRATVGASASFGLTTRSMQQLERQSKSTFKAMDDLKKLMVGFVGFTAIKEGVTSLIDAQVAMQSIKYTLVGALGSLSQAAQAFDFVVKTSDKLGLNLASAGQGFAQLSAAATANGIAMSKQQELFTALGQASTVMHLSADQSSRALLALEQMFSKGKVQAQELRLQLGQAIPGIVPRFEHAVLKMKEGTEDAGKSFDKLMQQGKLVTADVLPALIQAISEAGNGWEEASHGMNAELNRLSNAWLKLKVDMSNGLFSDMAIGSIRLMTNNLERLANVATAIAAISLARFGAGLVVGKRGSDGNYSGGLNSYIDKARQARDNADQARANAVELKQTADIATAHRRSAEATLADLQAKQQLAREQAKNAGVDKFSAIFGGNTAGIQQEYNQASVQLMKIGRITKEINRDQLKAEMDLQAARAAGSARAEKDALRRIANNQKLLDQWAIEKEMEAQRLNSARTLLITEKEIVRTRAAAGALKGIELNHRETSLAANAAANAAAKASSAFKLIGTGIKAIGTTALGLVGGPIGLLITAVTTVGFAFMDARSKAKAMKEEIAGSVQSIKDMREQLVAANKEFQRATTSMSVNDAAEKGASATKELQDRLKEVSDLQEQINKWNAGEASLKESQYGGMSRMLGAEAMNGFQGLRAEWAKMTGTYDAAKEKVEKLTPELEKLNQEIGRNSGLVLSTTWSGKGGIQEYLSGIYDKANSAKSGLEGLKQAASGLFGLGDAFKDTFNLRSAGTAQANKEGGNVEQERSDAQRKWEERDMDARQKTLNRKEKWIEGLAQAAGKEKKVLLSELATNKEFQEQSKAFDDLADYQGKLDAYKKEKKTGPARADELATLKGKIAELTDELKGGQGELAKFKAELEAGKKRGETAGWVQQMEAGIAQLEDLQVKLKAQKKSLAEVEKATGQLDDIQARLNSDLDASKDQLSGDLYGRQAAGAVGLNRQLAVLEQTLRNNGKWTDELAAKFDNLRQVQAQIDSNKLQLDLVKTINQNGAAMNANPNARKRAEADEEIRLLRERVSATQLTGDERVRLEEKSNEAIRSINDRYEFDTRASWKRQLDDWQNLAERMADVWGNAMNSGVEATLTFVETGKFQFKSFATDILKQIARIQLQKAIAGIAESFMTMGKTTAVQGSGNGGGSYSFDFAADANSGVVKHANGGVFGPKGSIPLKKYSMGGIANKPQLALYGEGRLPEAYVPLPDGRTIPVTMKGGSAGSAQPEMNVQVNVINQSGQQVQAKESSRRFDGKQMVLDVVLEAMNSAGSFREGMRNAVR
ncbi:tape measure protein [Dyella telluris]|uniref:Tape measure protein n=1 Tax=Dyella telluris TaxID=2763498 RepID=A0A7G8Q4F4_9GAMM|nr:tape measure protein [Dyella telluris]QNK01662.1 tape measure protein [Dyella telluris]